MQEISPRIKQLVHDFWKREREGPSLLKKLLTTCFEYHCPECHTPFKASINIEHGIDYDPYLAEQIQKLVDEKIAETKKEAFLNKQLEYHRMLIMLPLELSGGSPPPVYTPETVSFIIRNNFDLHNLRQKAK